MYLSLILFSLPLFVATFWYTWWIRGRGFGEFFPFLRTRPPERRAVAPDGGPGTGADAEKTPAGR